MKPPANNISSFDGLRALAVIAVMFVHIGFPGFVLGGLGVDLFFALSGFLITHLFIREYRRFGYVSLKYFWARRFLRLMPIYWIYLLGITALIFFGYGELTHDGQWTPAEYVASMWLYFVNYVPSGGIWSEQLLTIHLWSLALEEQFYLVWPLLIAALFRYDQLKKGALIILAIFVAYYWFLASDVEQLKTITGRGITLFFGCLFAILCNDSQYERWFTRVSATYVSLLVLLLLVLMSVLVYLGYFTENEVKVEFSAYFGLLFCFLMASLYHQQSTWSHRLFELPILAYVGKISYGLYLYHLAIQAIVWQWLYSGEVFGGAIDYLLRVLIYFVLTFGVATVSFMVVESYFLQFKDKFRN